ncbi:DUF2798 domain-containing protein [Azotobacter chroococcum]|uniref:DUF2798 domain-containing protein n=1 Tax=Azotobacter chroococcum TaxID=353 RepID=UPI0010AEC31B|nr:DUF2798 domain-containing protein [Azotobacter chroococcum]TKD46415.1 DUF2798 domain-containing protein [Azotobacter chroococcum]
MPSSKQFKLPVRTTPYAFALYMSAIMAFLMCLVITAANNGIQEDYLNNVLKAYKLAMPVAFVCVLLVKPIVLKLVSWTVHPARDSRPES